MNGSLDDSFTRSWLHLKVINDDSAVKVSAKEKAEENYENSFYVCHQI